MVNTMLTRGFYLFSAWLPVAQLLAPDHLSPVPDTQTPKSLKMKEMLSGMLESRAWTMWRMWS